MPRVLCCLAFVVAVLGSETASLIGSVKGAASGAITGAVVGSISRSQDIPGFILTGAAAGAVTSAMSKHHSPILNFAAGSGVSALATTIRQAAGSPPPAQDVVPQIVLGGIAGALAPNLAHSKELDFLGTSGDARIDNVESAREEVHTIRMETPTLVSDSTLIPVSERVPHYTPLSKRVEKDPFHPMFSHLDTRNSLVVVLSDVEGNVDRFEAMMLDAKSLGSTPRFVHLGDVWDPKPAQKSCTFRCLVRRMVHDYQMDFIHGNRDLNKLRFFTEFSHSFLKTLRSFEEGELRLALMRLYYWTIHPQRPQQKKDEQFYVDAAKYLAKEDPTDWFYHIVAHTMGVADPRNAYTHKNFEAEKRLPITKVVLDFLRQEFKDVLLKGHLMRIYGSMFVAHSGLGDYDLLASPISGDEEEAKWRWDPYKQFGGLAAAANVINSLVHADMKHAFVVDEHGNVGLARSMAVDPRTGVSLARVSLARAQHVLKALQESESFKTPFRKMLDQFGPLPPGSEDIVGYVSTPIYRAGERSIDGSLLYPVRTSFALEPPSLPTLTFRITPFPSLTGTAVVGFYTFLHRRLMALTAAPTAPEEFSHLCDMAATVKVAVFGHFGPPGPLVVRFPAEKLKLACESRDFANDLVVVFIDPTNYDKAVNPPALKPEVETVAPKTLQWSYVYTQNDAYFLRFAERVTEVDQLKERVHEVDLSVKENGDVSNPADVLVTPAELTTSPRTAKEYTIFKLKSTLVSSRLVQDGVVTAKSETLPTTAPVTSWLHLSADSGFPGDSVFMRVKG